MWAVTVNTADLSKTNESYFSICSKNSAKIIETLVHSTPLLLKLLKLFRIKCTANKLTDCYML